MKKDKTIKKMAGLVKNPEKNIAADNSLMKIERDWFLGLFVGILITGLGIFWSARSYNLYRDVLVTESTTSTGVTYSENLVETALRDFSLRENRFQEIIKEQSRVNVVPVIFDAEQEVENSTSSESEVEKPAPVLEIGD